MRGSLLFINKAQVIAVTSRFKAMTIGAKSLQIGGAVIEVIAVNVVDIHLTGIDSFKPTRIAFHTSGAIGELGSLTFPARTTPLW
jgi:hypothetical protein